MAGQPDPGVSPDGTLGRRWLTDAGGDGQSDDLRQGDRGLRRLRRAVRGADHPGASGAGRLWELVVDDIGDALGICDRPWMPVPAPTGLCRSSRTRSGARHRRHHPPPATCTGGSTEPNLFVKIPATARACPPSTDDRRGAEHQHHADLLAGPLHRGGRRLPRWARDPRRGGGDLASVHSVASFFVSRVDTEVDRRLEPSAPATRWPCEARPRSPRPSSPTGCSVTYGTLSAW